MVTNHAYKQVNVRDQALESMLNGSLYDILSEIVMRNDGKKLCSVFGSSFRKVKKAHTYQRICAAAGLGFDSVAV